MGKIVMMWTAASKREWNRRDELANHLRDTGASTDAIRDALAWRDEIKPLEIER